MTLVFAFGAAVLFGAGAYLVLASDLIRVVAGIVLISQSAVLVVLASGLSRGVAPIVPLADEPPSDPLVQAMALTAIVIGLGVTALLLAIVARALTMGRTTKEIEAAADTATELEAGGVMLEPRVSEEEETE